MKLIGKGQTAEVFELSDDKVLKLFYAGYDMEAIKREYENARLINSFNIAAPQAFELMEMDGRTGIVYTYVKGKSMETVFNSQVNMEQNLLAFCNLQKSFYEHEDKNLPSYKLYGEYLALQRAESKEEAARYVDFIKSFPDGDTVVHGDFHPLNVIQEDDGSLKVIDFMNLMRSPAEYDIARTYYLISQASPQFAEAYLMVMGYNLADISDYVELVKLYRKLEG